MDTLLLLNELFYNVSESQLITHAVQYNYILTNICPSGFVSY